MGDSGRGRIQPDESANLEMAPKRFRQQRFLIASVVVALMLTACGSAPEREGRASPPAAAEPLGKDEARTLCENLAKSKNAMVAAWGSTTAGEIKEKWSRQGVVVRPWSDLPAATPVADCSLASFTSGSVTTVMCPNGRLYTDAVEQFYVDRDGNSSPDPIDSQPNEPC